MFFVSACNILLLFILDKDELFIYLNYYYYYNNMSVDNI